jgi:hypothetical protein
VTVDYGFDMHSISITETAFAQIQAGHPLVVEGQGVPVEGFMEQDEWAFNYGTVGAVHVSTDTGREVFEGNLGDAEVEVQRGYQLRPTRDPGGEVN